MHVTKYAQETAGATLLACDLPRSGLKAALTTRVRVIAEPVRVRPAGIRHVRVCISHCAFQDHYQQDSGTWLQHFIIIELLHVTIVQNITQYMDKKENTAIINRVVNPQRIKHKQTKGVETIAASSYCRQLHAAVDLTAQC